MKIKSITPLKDKEGKDLWRIDFEESPLPMWTSFKPKSSVGNTIEDDRLQKSKKGTSWGFKKKGETPVSTSRKPTSSRDEDRTDIRTALMQANLTYMHTVAREVPFNDTLFDDIYQHFLKLVDPLIAEIIKKGGQIKKDAS